MMETERGVCGGEGGATKRMVLVVFRRKLWREVGEGRSGWGIERRCSGGFVGTRAVHRRKERSDFNGAGWGWLLAEEEATTVVAGQRKRLNSKF
ncbi:hypothetical protein HAX54_045484 [Datura stramonium]|uniref:Uncharacterized protein n=1 Tax=Datura stramonium TaxID=4076 RepID=A0ABS8WI90_DATST|nr:hypothetical protein [Datura stramonium]